VREHTVGRDVATTDPRPGLVPLRKGQLGRPTPGGICDLDVFLGDPVERLRGEPDTRRGTMVLARNNRYQNQPCREKVSLSAGRQSVTESRSVGRPRQALRWRSL